MNIHQRDAADYAPAGARSTYPFNRIRMMGSRERDALADAHISHSVSRSIRFAQLTRRSAAVMREARSRARKTVHNREARE